MRAIPLAARPIAIGCIAARSARHFSRAMCGTIPIHSMRRRWRRAAASVVGEKDFTSFAAVDPERGREGEPISNVRTIFSSSWERSGDELIYTVRGSGFLHHMVRNLVGTFILVGRGTLQTEDVTRIIDARSRSAAGATAPASGLYLVEVEY